MSQTEMDADTEKRVMQGLLIELMREQRSRKRWRIFFRTFLILFLSLIVLSIFLDQTPQTVGSHVGLVDIRGMIMDQTQSSADNIVKGLRKAYTNKDAKAIIIRINSPGGSPVQSSYVFNELMRLRQKDPKKKVYAVCVDVCASGAYYVAAAADQIFVNPSSLVGSIGVLMNGFGFVGAMEKVGVERRLITAGNNKGFLDPFSPLKVEDKQYAENILNDVHQQFIAAVKKGRGNKLHNNPDIFSGLAWSGEQAYQLGLVDGFKSAGQVARDIVKTDKMVDYTSKPTYIHQLSEFLNATVFSTVLNNIQPKLF